MKAYKYTNAEDFFNHMKKLREKEKWYEKLWRLFCTPFCFANRFYYRLKNGIYQIIVWLPIIYFQRDYEGEQIYDLMLYKIKRIKKEYVKHYEECVVHYLDKNDDDIKYKEDCKNQIEKIEKCEEILAKLIEDEYYDVETSDDKYKYSLEKKFRDKESLYFILCNDLEKWWT